MIHLLAYSESQDPGGSFAKVSTTSDDVVSNDGSDAYFVPEQFPNIVGHAGFPPIASGGTAGDEYEIRAPSLRRVANPRFPAIATDNAGDGDEWNLHPESPIALAPDEELEFYVNGNPGSAEDTSGLVWLADGAVSPATDGEMITIHGTASITATANDWASGNISLDDTLPDGTYSVRGMKVAGSNLLAGRLIQPGVTHRPGVVADTAITNLEDTRFRFGQMGEFLQFSNRNVPQLEVLATDSNSSQDVYLDVVRIS